MKGSKKASNVVRLPAKRLGSGQVGSGVEPDPKSASAAGEGETESSPSKDMTAHLVAVSERKDRDAFAALFGYYAPRLKSYLRRFGDSEVRAEEVLQETFVAIWSKAHLFDPSRASASTWIYAIARNQRIDAFRRERRPQFDPEDPAFVPENAPDGEVALTGKVRAEQVSAAMAELSEEQREVLRLSFFEDECHEAIARRLGLPLGTVKSRIRLAYGHLRTRLAPMSGGLL